MKLVVCENYLGAQILYRSLVRPIKNGVKAKRGNDEINAGKDERQRRGKRT